MRNSLSPAAKAAPALAPTPRSGLFSWLPGLWVLRHYQRAWLATDLLSGLVLTSMLVPAGMAYAEASGLPAVTGLYATIVPLLVYAVFGPSRIIVLGPDSGLVALVAVVTLTQGAPERALAMASTLAIMTGLLCLGAGLFRAGFLADLLSKPVRVGYLNGIALTVLVTQAPKLFGVSVRADGVLQGSLAFVQAVSAGQTRWPALAIGAACLATIFGLRAVAPKVPGIFIAVVVATLAVKWLALSEQLSIVGSVPPGFPSPRWPGVALSEWGHLLLAAAGIALVSFADTSVLSRTGAARGGYRVNANQELVGLGLANLAAGLFQGFPISSSSSRTVVAEVAGARTQLAGVVGALSITVLLVAAPSLLRDLPIAALAAVVIAAAVNLIDVHSVAVFRRVRRSDFVLSVVAFLGVTVLGVLPGIALAVVVSLLDFVRRAWHPHDAILGRAPGVQGYHDLARYPSARQVPGLIIFRWDAPLFFANADTFRQRVLEVIEANTAVRWVVVAAEPITDVDTTAAQMLEELDQDLAARGTELAFAELKDPVKDRLQRYGLQARIGRGFFFPTVEVAVQAYLEQHPVRAGPL